MRLKSIIVLFFLIFVSCFLPRQDGMPFIKVKKNIILIDENNLVIRFEITKYKYRFAVEAGNYLAGDFRIIEEGDQQQNVLAIDEVGLFDDDPKKTIKLNKDYSQSITIPIIKSKDIISLSLQSKNKKSSLKIKNGHTYRVEFPYTESKNNLRFLYQDGKFTDLTDYE